MSDKDNIFSDDPDKGQANTELDNNSNGESGNTVEDLLKGITKEDGSPKYQSVEDALAALQHSQKHIQTLEQEREQDRARLQELKKLEEKTSNLENTLNELASSTKKNEPQETPAVVDEEAVTQLVENFLKQKEEVTTRENNAKRVTEALRETYGDKAAEVVNRKAEEMGVAPSYLGRIAEESPKVFLNLFNNENVNTNSNPSTTSVHLPNKPQEEEELKRPEKSLLSGASSKEQEAFMKQVKDRVYKKYNVETN